ncbi:interleukin enhancer-binding factor 2 homolog isoform X2 [Colias croceus]|uniref:interleukin enhancer-binding factor 2 homolog isoform X1 n=1 Tax=Colias crocea TaxID=72248 RepID=UPI001E27A518|nr:interleukin enhancer-binding factor 2 homolog isoform X1 [Colias croceus]XP_045506058.1 interleukin enhancer-binding factor 2 homolog isoform X2 [Colias croceus]
MVRGSGRGRGMPGRGGMGRPPFSRPRVMMLRPPFDLILAEPAFPRCKPAPDDTALTQALLKRHAELCPTPAEQAAVLSLVTKLQTVLDNIVVAPGDFAACQLEEVRQVGSYKKGTMMAGKNVADIVVIMKTLPTKEAVEGLSNKVNEELNKLMRAEGLGNVSSVCHERGFTVTAAATPAASSAVRVLVTTLHQNLRKLEPEVHLDYKVISSHLAAIRHSRWFEENAHHSSIKVLIRLLRDMCARHSGLEPLTPWMIDLLAHHCIMSNPQRQVLPINVAFRRALALLAGGLFLPGCAGLPDPCEAAHARAHTALDLPAQDHAAATAQTLLRVVARGGHRYVLGLQAFEGGKDISTEITVWDGVVVSPLAPAYQETPEPMDTDDKDEEVPDGVAA